MLRRLLAVLILAATGLLVLPTGPAWACSCGVPLRSGDLVVVGVAESVDKPWFAEDLRVRLRVESVERGSAGPEIEIGTAAQGTACGYEFQEGYRYRVSVSAGSTSSCDGNEELGFVGRSSVGLAPAVWWSLGGGSVFVAALLLVRRRWAARDRRRGPAQ